ncbi:hypothetical protein [Streptococcus parauberis]|uniref:hypothetical protein n=1 Tax=Streptococcus parauberis TaxID=1348 RepID=UPI0037B9B45E
MKKEIANFVLGYYKEIITFMFGLSVLLNFGIALEHSAICDKYENKITDLKTELKSKDQQIKGLTGQLDRTQYQLKKVSEESADKTKRIAELTGNGG